ncbi:MAG TPA: ribose ABC transporter ATP-binding protein [Firmicutes bacterium]|jgi:ribose transport system substrate-binding protein|nr:ribose ABC transporter ATP-binding protein [Bacillota bacterium]
MFRKSFVLLMVLMLVVVSVSAVSFGAKKPVTIGVTFMTMDNPYFVAMEKNIRAELKKVDPSAKLIVADSQFNLAKQISDVEDMIQQKIDILFLNAVDSKAIAPAVVAANKANIPVITLDVNADGGKVTTYIGSDNYLAGKLDGEYMVKRLKGKGNVVIINGTPITSIIQRVQGVKDVLAKNPGIKVVAEQNGETNETKSMEIMENVLQSQHKIDAVFGANDPTGLGALAAVETAGRQKEMFILGVDGSPNGVDAIKKGKAFVATAAQFPGEIGRQGVQIAYKVLKGQKVPSEIKVKVQLITKDNAAGFSW